MYASVFDDIYSTSYFETTALSYSSTNARVNEN